jgi:hypothetical protein
MLAKATAREAGAKFINLDIALITDKWWALQVGIAKH